MLKSPFHEARLLALFMLVAMYSKGAGGEKQAIYRAYLGNTKYINNWDLVDSSAEHIVGAYLFDRKRKPLYRLVRSRSLWERRISIMSTFRFIKAGDFADTLVLAQLLLHDREDLIHKAVGWMLRYAIEKFPEAQRQAFLRGDR